MEIISVIVPIYNVASYLPACLDSIIHQSYQDLEIILVNDGSTDDSLTICRQYQQRDKRIRIISQKNGGVSAARNTGIEAANGLYITFVDPDDWLSTTTALETLYNLLQQKHVDIAIGSFNIFNDEESAYYLYEHSQQISIYPVKQWLRFAYSDEITSQCVSTLWGKLFKKDLFEHLRFPVGKIDEDDLCNWQLYLLTKSVVFLDEALYIYRNNRSSSITAVANPAQLFSLPAIEQRITMNRIIGCLSIKKKLVILGVSTLTLITH